MFIQTYVDKTVLDAAVERVSFVFDSFEDVIVSISGGKDSTVLAHLAIEEASRRNRKVGLFFLDEEVVFQATVDQVEYLMGLRPNAVNRLWLQIPFCLTNATSPDEPQLLCWEPGKHKKWMRPKGKGNMPFPPWPKGSETIKDKRKGFGFYDVFENFERRYSGAAFLVGLRAYGESPNRYRAVVKHPVDINGHKVFWATASGTNVKLYPIYDWIYSDVWRYIHDEALQYHKSYDWYLKKGRHVGDMRVSSLVHERSFHAICELPEFEPKTYEKLRKRIKGVSLAQETAKTKMFRVNKLPSTFSSWITYKEFLLDTHRDQSIADVFRRRFSKHLRNEYVARQQCRQVVLNDYENNLPIDNKPDPREELIRYYDSVL